MGENNRVIYRRRNLHPIRHKGRVLTDQYVVGYNKWALKKYNCHLNVDIVQSHKAPKYLYEYVFKREDCARMQIIKVKSKEVDEDGNEVERTQTKKVVSRD